jgi:hypothetical protein
MPFNPTLPTWTGLNQANSASSSGQTDLRTGLALQGGNLVPGDYFDLTEAEANALSYTTTGTLHAGRYRWVLVDSAATAANVKTGTVGLLRSHSGRTRSRATIRESAAVLPLAYPAP